MISVKDAARTIAALSDSTRSAVLTSLAHLIESETATLLKANADDLSRMDKSNPLYDRLMLTPERLHEIAAALRQVAALPCPVGEVIEQRTLANGIDLKRVRSPFGVIGIIYEARPNVTYDVFALCLKSANACILKGGHDADSSNRAAISLIHRALAIHGLPQTSCMLMPSTPDAATAMLTATGIIDVCIPRGGRRLIDYVRDNARVPVIETGAGVVHTYIDRHADIDMARDIILNAKTRRVSVCNALDSIIIHSQLLDMLPKIVAPLSDKNVEIHADDRAMQALMNHYPTHLLTPATPADRDREWMDYKLGVYTVDSVDEAIAHIAAHGSGHSESIVTSDDDTARLFMDSVDASCVYHNLPTSFTDGGQFELGAEIGISTQKLGPRGPMGLRQITTYRYLLSGRGQLRP